MASKAHGKFIVYVTAETKGSLIELIRELNDRPEIRKALAETHQRFVTYDQAIKWALAHQPIKVKA